MEIVTYSEPARRRIAETVRRVLGTAEPPPAVRNVLQAAAPVYFAKVTDELTARSGTTLGTGTVKLLTVSDGVYADATDETGATISIDVYNPSTQTLAVDSLTFVLQEQMSGAFFAVFEDCP